MVCSRWIRKCQYYTNTQNDYVMLTHSSLFASHHPDNKVHEANMGPTWVLSAPDGPHVGLMNLVIRAVFSTKHWVELNTISYGCKPCIPANHLDVKCQPNHDNHQLCQHSKSTTHPPKQSPTDYRANRLGIPRGFCLFKMTLTCHKPLSWCQQGFPMKKSNFAVGINSSDSPEMNISLLYAAVIRQYQNSPCNLIL